MGEDYHTVLELKRDTKLLFCVYSGYRCIGVIHIIYQNDHQLIAEPCRHNNACHEEGGSKVILKTGYYHMYLGVKLPDMQQYGHGHYEVYIL